MTVLVVVAHPDDEVLAAGGCSFVLVSQDVEVRACILSSGAGARASRPRSQELYDDLLSAGQVLGLGRPILGDFPNICLNMVPHIELVQFIEAALIETQADTIITHHPRDLNDDHKQVSFACQAAARLFQRRDDLPALSALFFAEILSSTEWSYSGSGASFEPDTFFEIGIEGLEKKVEALSAYRGVMRDYPHPRSREALRGLAAYRGAQAGMRYAEGFQTAFKRAVDPNSFS